MRDFSQIDLIDMYNRRHGFADGASEDEDAPERPCHPAIDWLGAQKPLHLIAFACAIIAAVRAGCELLG